MNRSAVTAQPSGSDSGWWFQPLIVHIVRKPILKWHPWSAEKRGWGVPGFSHIIPIMCFSTSNRFVNTSLLSPTIVVLFSALLTLRGRGD